MESPRYPMHNALRLGRGGLVPAREMASGRWVVCGNFENGEYSPHEVYSAVAHTSSVRLFFNLVAFLDIECH